MPIEIRHLIFDETEVTSALVAYDRRTRPQNVTQTVADMRLDDFPTMRAYLTLRAPDGTIDVAEFSAAQIAAALILHCRNARIPLAARAGKNVRLVNGGVCLSLSLNAPPGLQAALTPESLAAVALGR